MGLAHNNTTGAAGDGAEHVVTEGPGVGAGSELGARIAATDIDVANGSPRAPVASGVAGGGAVWTWVPHNCGGAVPEARHGHTATRVGRKIFVIGGVQQARLQALEPSRAAGPRSHRPERIRAPRWDARTLSGQDPFRRGIGGNRF